MFTGRIKFQDSHLIYQDGLLIREVIEGVGETEYQYLNTDQVEKTRLKSKEVRREGIYIFTSYFYDDNGNLIQEIETTKEDRKDSVVKVTTYKLIRSLSGESLGSCDIMTTINGKIEGKKWGDFKDMTCTRYEVVPIGKKKAINMVVNVDGLLEGLREIVKKDLLDQLTSCRKD